MARYLIPSDATIRATKPHDDPFRLNDGDGLYLSRGPCAFRATRDLLASIR